MQSLADFHVFYNHTIHPELIRMEQKRKQLLWLFALSILLLAAVIGLVYYLGGAFAFAIILLIPLGLYASYLAYSIRRFQITFKPHVVDLILDFIDDHPNFGTLSYNSKKKIEKKKFLKSGLFAAKIKEYRGEDYIKGKIGELDFELCELDVQSVSKVKTEMSTIFRGVFLIARFNIVAEGRVMVFPTEMVPYRSKAIKNFIKQGARKVDGHFEVESFRELYDIFATDKAVLHKTLNREMQIQLADYRIQTDKTVYFAFQKDKIYIAVSQDKDILEPNILRSNAHFDLVKEFYEDLEMLFNIVERIDENN